MNSALKNYLYKYFLIYLFVLMILWGIFEIIGYKKTIVITKPTPANKIYLLESEEDYRNIKWYYWAKCSETGEYLLFEGPEHWDWEWTYNEEKEVSVWIKKRNTFFGINSIRVNGIDKYDSPYVYIANYKEYAIRRIVFGFLGLIFAIVRSYIIKFNYKSKKIISIIMLLMLYMVLCYYGLV